MAYITRQHVAKMMLEELNEFDELRDTIENIAAPMDQLTPKGQAINRCLHELGITNPGQIEYFEEILYAFRLACRHELRIELDK